MRVAFLIGDAVEGLHAQLCAAVGDAGQKTGIVGGARADVDDGAGAARFHLRHEQVGKEIGADQIDIGDDAPVFGSGGVDAAVGDVGAGVVDQHMDGAELGVDLFDGGADLGLFADVAGADEGTATVLLDTLRKGA